LAHHDPSTRPHHAFAGAIAERNADRATRLFVEHTYQARSSLLAALASAG
jgi:DNA-binding GntR family transcriptional regulator